MRLISYPNLSHLKAAVRSGYEIIMRSNASGQSVADVISDCSKLSQKKIKK